MIEIDAEKGTINVQTFKKRISLNEKNGNQENQIYGSGTLWKYAQSVGPAFEGEHHPPW